MFNSLTKSNFEFQALGSRKVEANFQGGHLSSDGGGALFLREIESRSLLILDRFPKVRLFIAEKFSPEFDDFLS